jgi:hypothetical protein
MANKGLFVGINAYHGSSLRGCLNDVDHMIDLARSYGYTDITFLKDDHATQKNITTELRKLIKDSVSGDILIWHYSGHGCQVAAINGGEADYLDEAIVPYDYNIFGVIRDDDIYSILSQLPKGVLMYVIFDCCHSGDGVRDFSLEKQNRFMVIEETERKDIYPISDSVKEINANTEMGDIILISGCMSNQTSADAYINKEYQGALSYMLTHIASQTSEIDLKSLILAVNIGMDQMGFDQNPQLECKDELKTRLFLK